MTELALRSLDRPLARSQRRSLRAALAALLDWQRRLGRFPRTGAAPDATPIVSLYAGGLRGCSASSEGAPRERVLRAFLLALGDSRYGGISPEMRARAVAQVAYPANVRRVSLDAAPRVVAPGAHGLALALDDAFPVLLVPDVAREHALDADGLLAALEHKAGLSAEKWPRAGLFTFETDAVVARRGPPDAYPADPIEASIRWLSERVRADGAVTFGRDPRASGDEARGPMHHGRAAVVVQALSAHRSGQRAARRARKWLEREIEAGLSGARPEAFPDDVPALAGTLALASLAGIPVRAPLRDIARRGDVSANPWHAAQVACALGIDTPDSLWRGCVRALDADPRAPWVAMAAARRGDWTTFERVAVALAANVREHGPHRGGVGPGSIPEVALTALTVEALSPARTSAVARARELALAFLARTQISSDALPEARDTRSIHGAWPLTPVHTFLRADVTAHAALAHIAPIPRSA